MITRYQNRLILIVSLCLAVILMVWALRMVDLRAVLAVLHRIQFWQILLLLGVNGAIVALFSGRWWQLLRLQGERLPYWALSLYRLSGFGVSYFTPGPQFGGEPWQVVLLNRHHGVPVSTAVSAVALDKLLELLANFSFLAFGIMLGLQWRMTPQTSQWGYVLPLGGLLFLPLFILLALGLGKLPAGYLLTRYPAAPPLLRRALLGFAKAEISSAELIRAFPAQIVMLIVYSLLVWVALVGEYWLTLRFFGVELSLIETILALTAARLAFLTPIPGGLGALEASQIYAMQALGLDGNLGLSISLFIRGRDILFAVCGLMIGALFITRRTIPIEETCTNRELIDLHKGE